MHSPITFHGDRRRHPLVARTPTIAPKTRTAVQADERARHTAWLNWVGARTGKSDTALAKEAGQSENTLTRFRNREGAVLSGLTIRLICEMTGLPGPETYLLPNSSGFSEEATAYETGSLKGGYELLDRMIELALHDRTNSAAWVLKSTALENAGYLSGDVLITDASIAPTAGDVVCAQIYDLRRGTAETVFRLFEPPYLIAASNDPALRKPLLVDNERVIVMATVTETFRPRRS